MNAIQETYENLIEELKVLRLVRTPEEAECFIDKLDELSRIPLDLIEDKAYCMYRLFEIPDEESVHDATDGVLWMVEKFKHYLDKEDFIQIYFRGFNMAYFRAYSWLSNLFTRLYEYHRPDLQQEFEHQLHFISKDLKSKLIIFFNKIKEENRSKTEFCEKMIYILNK